MICEVITSYHISIYEINDDKRTSWQTPGFSHLLQSVEMSILPWPAGGKNRQTSGSVGVAGVSALA